MNYHLSSHFSRAAIKWRAGIARRSYDRLARQSGNLPHPIDAKVNKPIDGDDDRSEAELTISRLRRKLERRDRAVWLLAAPYVIAFAPVLLPIFALRWLRNRKGRQLRRANLRTPVASRERAEGWARALADSNVFDEEWYTQRYAGLIADGGDPLMDFVEFGVWLDRCPNAEFDPDFYRRTYRDVPKQGSVAVHYLEFGLKQERPTHFGAAQEKYRSAVAEASRNTIGDAPQNQSNKLLSYCIPIMNRLEDIQSTLPFNLWDNQAFSSSVEFIVVVFDRDERAADWLNRNFEDEIASDYLRVERSLALPQWHFGRAKNEFRKHMRGSMYSSLDGDNYVTAAETRIILDMVENHPNGFVFHQFLGKWGDGSCGRVSMPSSLYKAIGYDESFLPTQFDDIDLILSVLTRFPHIPLICYGRDSCVLDKPGRARGFVRQVNVGNPVIYLDQPAGIRSPANPKGSNYLRVNPLLNAMNAFNATASFQKNAWTLGDRQTYWRANAEARMQLVETWEAETAFQAIFHNQIGSLPSILPSGAEPGVTMLACVKDDSRFLHGFLSHHRDRGVHRFLIVDDNSAVPLCSAELGRDVHIFRPSIGEFRTGKGLWLEILLRRAVIEGEWVLVADVDERVDLPPGIEDFSDLVRRLQDFGFERAPGLLVEMLPNPSIEESDSINNPFPAFDHRCEITRPISAEYARNPSIRWGFGLSPELSWRVDARYHAYGTFDSLRKIPLFRHRLSRHLHDGFHATYIRGTKGFVPEPIEEGVLLPVRHYKMMKLLFEEDSRASLQVAQGYHPRSSENVSQIFSGNEASRLASLRSVPSVPYRAADFARFPS
jgi:hypothetical protein